MQRLAQIAARPAIWMTAVLVAVYWQVALCQHPLQWDAVDQIYVWHRYIAECFHAHLLPLWSPYSRLGYPMYADPQSGLFYPIVWLLTLGGRYTLVSNNAEFMIHVVLAAWGMKQLLEVLGVRRMTASLFGVLYAMSGPIVAHATHTTLVVSMAWIPFVLASYTLWLRQHRTYHLLLTVLYVYMEVAGGYMGVTIILMYVMAVVAVYHVICRGYTKRFFKSHLLLGSIVGLASMGYLYAVAQGQPYIDRGGGLSRATAGGIPFTPVCLLTLVYPGLQGDSHIAWGTDITMQSLYIGIVPLLLSIILLSVRPRRSNIFIMVASIVVLLAAMGDYTPVRGWLYDYIPLMRLFRHAGIFRLFSCLGLIILGARGFDALDEHRFRSTFRAGATLLFLGSAVLWLVALCGGHTLFSVIAVAGRSVVFITLLTVIIISAPDRWIAWPMKRMLLGLLIIIDLGLSVQQTMFTTIASDRRLADIQKIIDRYPSGFPLPPNDPITSYGQWNDSMIAPPLWQNAGFIRKQFSFEGYNGFNLKSYNLFRERSDFFQRYGHQPLVSSHSSSTVYIRTFDPCHFGIDIAGDHSGEVVLAQMYFPGWQARVDNISVPVTESQDHFVTCNVAAGPHKVDFYFSPWGGKAALIYTVLAISLLILAIRIYRHRLN